MNKLFLLLFLAVSINAFPQCEILNRIYPDGSMLYYIEPVNFYWTESKELKGGVITDMENYYLSLLPSPFPPKPEGNKLKENAELKLANDSIYIMEHFDTRYLDNDSVMQMLFLINQDDVNDLLKYEAISVKINMGEAEGIRAYVFKLHKAALMEQLDCFLKEKEEGREHKKE